MNEQVERPYLQRHPIKSLIAVTIVLAVLSVVLLFTVVGSILALPLMIVAAITGLAAWYKLRRRPHFGSRR
jgi:predicted PurR-regulated permease PerM